MPHIPRPHIGQMQMTRARVECRSLLFFFQFPVLWVQMTRRSRLLDVYESHGTFRVPLLSNV